MSRELTKKERMALPRQPMPSRDPGARIRDFDEVALGFDENLAVAEAERCLECKRPKCVDSCPVGIDIPSFVMAVREGRFEEALRIVMADNTLPAICGRVCPQEDQCEKTCVTGTKGEPVAIGRLERFVADYHRMHGAEAVCGRHDPTGFKVAVVGSGPAGLACASFLASRGHEVTVFEALHKPGGVLVYGIPEFRLPKAIVDDEVNALTGMGVEFRCNFLVGATASLRELMDDWGYSAIFLGTGAGLPHFLGIEGENLIGVSSANEFLTRVNLMRAFDFPSHDTPVRVGNTVAVVGAGNVAMDCARTALRLGCEHVLCLYRRTRAQAPARIEELEHAEEEGVDFRWLTNPVELLGNDEGVVTGVRVQRMQLGEADGSGRPRPVAIEGTEHAIPIDSLIVGIGQSPNPLLTSCTEELEVDRWGRIVVDSETLMTSIPGVFAGGDIVTGAATVILAMGAGKRAGQTIDGYLCGSSGPVGPSTARTLQDQPVSP